MILLPTPNASSNIKYFFFISQSLMSSWLTGLHQFLTLWYQSMLQAYLYFTPVQPEIRHLIKEAWFDPGVLFRNQSLLLYVLIALRVSKTPGFSLLSPVPYFSFPSSRVSTLAPNHRVKIKVSLQLF